MNLLIKKNWTIKFILLLLLFQIGIHSQISNPSHYNLNPTNKILIDTSDFFPLQVGNLWQFRATISSGPEYINLEVIGDTLLNNGLTYKYLRETDTYGSFAFNYYFRKDTGSVFLYFGDSIACINREYKYFDFLLEDSTIWNVCRDLGPCGNARGIGYTYYDYTYYTFLQKPLETKLFADVLVDSTDTVWVPCENRIYWLSKALGITRIFYFNVGDFQLLGAIIDGQQFGTLVSIENEFNAIPSSFQLKVYPNPFNSTVNFNFTLPLSGTVALSLYNILGEKVATIINEYRNFGSYNIEYNSSNIPSGIYLAELRQGKNSSIQKLILLK